MHNLTRQTPHDEMTEQIPSEQNKHSRITARKELERIDDALLLVLPRRLQHACMARKET